MALESEDYDEIPSDLVHPTVPARLDSLARIFPSGSDQSAPRPPPLRNPHHENKVSAEVARHAIPAAVLIPIVERPEGLGLLLTRRHENISFSGHICFPGGRSDPDDENQVDTALRENHEEIGLAPDSVRVLGALGDYVTQSGFRITPIVGVIRPPLDLSPSPGEVDAILEMPLALTFRADSYRLIRRGPDGERGLFVLEHDDYFVTGPTVSIMIGLYESVLMNQ